MDRLPEITAAYEEAAETLGQQRESVSPFALYRLTVAQYHQMIDTGILGKDDPVELLEGWLVQKMPKNPKHRFSTQTTHALLLRLLPEGWFADAQEPITTADSEPEPDIAIIRGSRRDYLERHPTPADIAVIIEMSDSTLHYDQRIKQRIYAASSIPVYCRLNMTARRMEVYTEPVGAGNSAAYRTKVEYDDSQQVVLPLDNQTSITLTLKDLLP
jgi:Uma2 family endonuclease